MITVTALSPGVRSAQGKVPGSLEGVATGITVTTATRPASGPGQITPEPYVQHSDVLGSPSQGPPEASAVAATARLPDVGAAAGGLVLTEIKTTIPADNMPPPPSFQPPAQVSVTGVDLGHPGPGPLATARLISSRAFAPDLYIPMARAQAPAKLGGQVNIVHVAAASAAAVGAVTGEISRLLPPAPVTNPASLAGEMARSLQTTARLARSPAALAIFGRSSSAHG